MRPLIFITRDPNMETPAGILVVYNGKNKDYRFHTFVLPMNRQQRLFTKTQPEFMPRRPQKRKQSYTEGDKDSLLIPPPTDHLFIHQMLMHAADSAVEASENIRSQTDQLLTYVDDLTDQLASLHSIKPMEEFGGSDDQPHSQPPLKPVFHKRELSRQASIWSVSPPPPVVAVAMPLCRKETILNNSVVQPLMEPEVEMTEVEREILSLRREYMSKDKAKLKSTSKDLVGIDNHVDEERIIATIVDEIPHSERQEKLLLQHQSGDDQKGTPQERTPEASPTKHPPQKQTNPSKEFKRQSMRQVPKLRKSDSLLVQKPGENRVPTFKEKHETQPPSSILAQLPNTHNQQPKAPLDRSNSLKRVADTSLVNSPVLDKRASMPSYFRSEPLVLPAKEGLADSAFRNPSSKSNVTTPKSILKNNSENSQNQLVRNIKSVDAKCIPGITNPLLPHIQHIDLKRRGNSPQLVHKLNTSMHLSPTISIHTPPTHHNKITSRFGKDPDSKRKIMELLMVTDSIHLPLEQGAISPMPLRLQRIRKYLPRDKTSERVR